MTKDKTVTMSRELADRLALKPAPGITDPCTIRTLNSQFHAALDELRALLAAPIVEADGMGEAVAWALLNGNGQVRELTARWDVAKHWGGIVETLYTSPPAPVSVDPHAIATKVRTALDRQACPNPWMVIAYEATVEALTCLDKVKELNHAAPNPNESTDEA